MTQHTKQTGSPDQRAKSPTGQVEVEVPEPKRKAEDEGDVSAGEATLEASPVPLGSREGGDADHQDGRPQWSMQNQNAPSGDLVSK